MDENARSAITKARAQLILKKPFFGYLATYLEPKEMANMAIKTIGTDGKYLYYDPDFVRSLDKETLMGAIAHEVFHCAFGHLWRRGFRDMMRWNIATDIVANEIIKSEGLALPDEALFNPSFKGLSAEEAYNKLTGDKGSDDDDGGGCGGKVSDGDSDNEGRTGSNFDDHSEWGKKKNGKDDGIGNSEINQKWREYASRARQMAKVQGSGAGSLEDMVDELLEPKLNWKELLKQSVVSSVISDYQLSPPSKRHIWRNIYLPSAKKSDAVEVIFAVDTSGSMTTEEIRDALSELKGICEQFSSFTIFYVECDWDIQRVIKLTPYSFNMDEVKKIRGRGGTRFPVSLIFEEVSKKHTGRPDTIIYFTDGYGRIAGEKPPCPVIWLLCSTYRFDPEFGRVIKYERDQR